MSDRNPAEMYDRDVTDIVLRFRDVTDIESLKIDIELMLESLSEDGVIYDMDD